ncbi:MAG: (Fe-S)-binding protein [Chloroflexi bacterium]|nr:(Fe-S)-binding protein [Chloroflexota bacterium]
MRKLKIDRIGKDRDGQLVSITSGDLSPLPLVKDEEPPIKPLSDRQRLACEASLDGVSALALPRPRSKAEEARLVQTFLSGLKKLFSRDDNWTFLQPLALSLDYCARCLLCSEDCPVYLASGRQEAYRPAYRAEVLRRIKRKYIDGGGLAARLTEGDIELNWTTIARLAELAYRCTLCRRCAQSCDRGVDNALITHELRKLFSQEMGIAPRELHEMGTVQQLKVGASTGINPKAFGNIIAFAEQEIEDRTGLAIKIPVDREGADFLLMHNSGEYLSWLENIEAFAIIYEAAGLKWTLSSELAGYEATNYGVWYDDIQFARIALRQCHAARKLGVRKIVIGECGHAHKALTVVADRLLTDDTYVPRESYLPALAALVTGGRLKVDPARNDFPVTLHDPCNMVRLMGIVEPQRAILKSVCTRFREMAPHGVNNYCCGGGSGFAVMSATNFADWRSVVAGRLKLKQVLDAFGDVIDPATRKYVCAPCSNCKGQLRDLFARYDIWGRYGILYGGLVELVVNAMVDIKKPFVQWEWR